MMVLVHESKREAVGPHKGINIMAPRRQPTMGYISYSAQIFFGGGEEEEKREKNPKMKRTFLE